MNKQAVAAGCVVATGMGPVLRAFGDEVTVHLGGDETQGKFCMFTGVTPPGGGPPRHYHVREDEWFHVLEGRAEFWKEGRWVEVGAGGSVFTPRGVVHTFRNPGDVPLRMLVHTSPAGFEVFFGKCAEEFAKPGGTEMGRLAEIAGEHGIRFVDEEGDGR